MFGPPSLDNDVLTRDRNALFCIAGLPLDMNRGKRSVTAVIVATLGAYVCLVADSRARAHPAASVEGLHRRQVCVANLRRALGGPRLSRCATPQPVACAGGVRCFIGVLQATIRARTCVARACSGCCRLVVGRVDCAWLALIFQPVPGCRSCGSCASTASWLCASTSCLAMSIRYASSDSPCALAESASHDVCSTSRSRSLRST